MMPRLRAALLMLGLTSLALLAACVDTAGTEVFGCPNRGVFIGQDADAGIAMQSVSTFIERRCGTLECHGTLYRPMRIYGRFGLRAQVEPNVPGGKPTTAFEHDANYGAVCSIEPDKMAEVANDFGQSADKLLFVQKARGVEGHKGGTVVTPGSAGDKCILGWLRGDPLETVAARCQEAIDALE